MKITSQQMEIIFDIGRQLGGDAALDELLHKIAGVAADLMATESAEIFLFDEKNKNQLRFVAASRYKDHLLNIPVLIDGSIVGAVFTSGKPVIVPKVGDDPRYHPGQEDANRFETHSLLAVPLQYRENKIGVLTVGNKLGDLPFAKQDVEILTLLALQATIAIGNAHQFQIVRQKLAERERLTGDLKAFSGPVAHNIKGLLGTILGYSELIARDAGQAGLPMLSEWSGALIEAVMKVGGIVDILVLLSKVRQQDATVSPLNMGAIVSNAERRLANKTSLAQVRIAAPSVWPIAVGYAPWLEDVWIQYLSNAIQYGGNPPQVELGAEAFTNPQTGAAEIRFWVHDNGKGLAPESQASLFVEFEYLGQSRSTGYGLGLTLVKRIITKLGGQVGVQSAVGQGSTFFFTLPAYVQGGNLSLAAGSSSG